jgi:hypothetical protein
MAKWWVLGAFLAAIVVAALWSISIGGQRPGRPVLESGVPAPPPSRGAPPMDSGPPVAPQGRDQPPRPGEVPPVRSTR